MNPGRSSSHPASAGEASTRFAFETLRGFQRLKVDVIVIGGWAVRLYGSPVYSIDLDILVPPHDANPYDVHDFIEARRDVHRTAFDNSYLETNELDAANKLWVLGVSYRPGDLISIFGQRRLQVTIDRHEISAAVPVPEVLTFMKLKAALNRANKLNALQNPVRRAGLADDDRELLEGLTEEFFVRKIAKDLVDISFLLARHTSTTRVLEVAAASGIRSSLNGLLPTITQTLFDQAEAIVAEHGVEVSCSEQVGALFSKLRAA